MFHYDKGSRSGDVARELLLQYNGVMQTDRYSAYDQFERIPGITIVCCWAHARRKWVESLDENKEYATYAINTIAISYTYSLLLRLSRYVNDGRIHIDNNLIENAIRPLAIGRKNWLFCANDASAYRAAIVYSLIGSCKNAGVNPREWMEDVLRKMPYYLRNKEDLSELLPLNWKHSRQVQN